MEYNKKFTDNIKAIEFNQKAKDVANWIEENKESYDWAKDPNAYEMTNIFLFAEKYIFEGKNVNLEPVKKIWELRKEDFKRCGIEDNQFVYQICKQSYDAAISGRTLVSNESSHNSLRKMAGIGLNLMQQKREKGQGIDYNNTDELINLIKDTKILKQKNLQIHDNLKFENNINILYKIQKLHLNEKNSVQLDKAYNNYVYTHNKISKYNVMQKDR